MNLTASSQSQNPSPEKLNHQEYSNALDNLTQEDHKKQQELFDLLKTKQISGKEFITKQQERNNEFYQKHLKITKSS